MLKRTYLDLSGRVLPLRSGHFSLQSPSALALRLPAIALPAGGRQASAQIWFTPEAVVWDAFCVVYNVLLVWRLFCRIVDRFALRALVIAGLIFVVASLSDSPNSAVAGVSDYSTSRTAPTNSAGLQLSSKIIAVESPIFSWPVPKTYISCNFSSFHHGIDIPNPYGTPVKPLAAGTVVFAGWDGGFGNTVVIQHNAGFLSRYSHLSKISATRGQKVDNTNIIGSVGASGFATGNHLHFEIYQNGRPINPLTILP